MAKKEIAVKKYVVKLSAEERKRLEALIHAGKNSARMLTRARILLKADVSEAGEGWSDSANLGGAGHQRQQRRAHASAAGRGGVRGDAEAQVQSQLRPAADLRRGGGGEADRSGLLARAGWVRALDPASPRRESRRIEHRREGQRQYDRTDA